MVQNYFKTAWRNVSHDKRTLFLNITGLSVGIAAVFLLFTVVRFETSYDTFHANARQIYRVVTLEKFDSGIDYNAGVPNPLPEALKTDIPNLRKVVPLKKFDDCQLTIAGAGSGQPRKFREEAVYFTEPGYFDLFDSKWLSGDPEALNDPGVIVLDRSMADKFFGNWNEATGQTILVENVLPVKVGGVIESIPSNTNLPLDLIISFATVKANADLLDYDPAHWGATSSNFQTYILLDKQTSGAAIDKQLKIFSAKHYKDTGISGKTHQLQALEDIHFDTRFRPLKGSVARRSTLNTLLLIGSVIILMASVNYINIATVQSVIRGREIGIRKTLGARRSQLIAMALGETLIVTTAATVLAIGMAWLGMPYLKHFSNVPDTIEVVRTETLWFALAIIAAVTLLAGIYPALSLSDFRPALVFRTRINTARMGGIPLRRVLIVFQFAIAQILVVAMLVANRQLVFMQDTDLGFDKEAVYYVNLPWEEEQSRNKAVFKQQLLRLSSVQSVSLTTDVPSSDNNWVNNFYFDYRDEKIPFHTSLKFGDADYFSTFGLQFLAGKAFAARDTMYEAVINETLLHKLGMQHPGEALGKTIRIGGHDRWMEITGVVKDFATHSLHEEIKPVLIASNHAWYQVAGIKLSSDGTRQALAAIQELWESHFPDHVYNGNFLDDTIAGFYRHESQLVRVYQAFALLAVFISCMGLFGIVSFITVQKTREIGIRKVLGASVSGIVAMLSKDFATLVLIAVAIASPIAWWAMNQWLLDFAYRIRIEWWMFAVTGLAAIAIALLTVSYESIRAALANGDPVSAAVALNRPWEIEGRVEHGDQRGRLLTLEELRELV